MSDEEKAPFTVATGVLVWNTPSDGHTPVDGKWVDVLSYPDNDDRWHYTSLAPYTATESMPEHKRQMFALSEALHLIIDHGLDPNEVHRALLKVQEYRDALACDYAMGE